MNRLGSPNAVTKAKAAFAAATIAVTSMLALADPAGAEGNGKSKENATAEVSGNKKNKQLTPKQELKLAEKAAMKPKLMYPTSNDPETLIKQILNNFDGFINTGKPEFLENYVFNTESVQGIEARKARERIASIQEEFKDHRLFHVFRGFEDGQVPDFRPDDVARTAVFDLDEYKYYDLTKSEKYFTLKAQVTLRPVDYGIEANKAAGKTGWVVADLKFLEETSHTETTQT